ncbi:hypothetical protein TCAL_03594 [Tigriopus californicus]|uniref:Protein AATF n=1 Tax=Tigriopus californicus TaxID=6832 RepID=A0A553NEZ8_TIGCA|nr:protein AATF-like [Tigriopus californicus]TRY63985.1 hypothetical protein TCAL_03594 [Tigriopus californicus]|eukprot:TCALIF_03594-PA protein Name:"Similar to AATF Protein AATF (Gallus gallus)" AED:0.01 eAED:0.04 QI:0/-1/0/1/-1/1/1/0/558
MPRLRPKRKGLQAQIDNVVAPKLRDNLADIEEDEAVSKAKVVGQASDSGDGSSGSDLEEADFDYEFAQAPSSLRRKAAPSLAQLDPKYRGLKVSRRALKQGRGDGQSTLTVDEKEHDQADWGHMFDESGEDEGEDEDEEEEGKPDESEEDQDGEDQDEEEGGGGGGGFTFDQDMDFNKFGSMMDYEDKNVEDKDDLEEDDDDKEENDSDKDSDEEELDDDNDEDDNEDLEEENKPSGPISTMSSQNLDKEVAKGRAIQNQMKIWESLLEVRIQLQKALGKINQYPQPSSWPLFQAAGDDQYREDIHATQKCLDGVMDEILYLEDEIIQNNPNACQALKRPISQENNDDPTSVEPKPKMSKQDRDLQVRFERLIPMRNEVIEKWNDKTRLASGVVKSKSFAGFETSTLKQIEHLLLDKPRLIKRTQVRRSAYQILGTSPDESHDSADIDKGHPSNVEIFDDDDFYHQLLKEFIDRKASSVTDPHQLGQHWLQIQKMRSKMKRKVDTKASKGRKTRYDIHAKLVNFMAPIYTQSWKDESKNELYASLFGAKNGPSKLLKE